MKIDNRVLAGVLITVGVSLLISCARRPVNIENLPLPSAQELISQVNRNREALRDFSGAGSIEMTGPELRRTVLGLRVEYLKPDYLFLHLKGPLGVNAGSFVLAGDYYSLKIFADHVKKSGRINELQYPPGMDLLVSSQDLRNLFQPLISAEGAPDSAMIERDLKAQQIRLSWPEGDVTRRLWADPYQPLFLQELITSALGDSVWYKQVGSVKKRGPVFLPSAWSVRVGQDQEAFRLKLKLPQLQVNTGLSPDDFKIKVDSTEDHGG